MIDTKSLPHQPGCYLFSDGKKVIYVGKAKDLQKRVSSYFAKNHSDEKTRALVNNIQSVDYIVTHSEVEALLLENNLIKKHTPKYNIDLKDGKRYAYIRLTQEEFPRLLIARDKKMPGTYFGPFVSAATRDYVLQTVIKMFGIRTCRKLPKRACLRYHIKLCTAPCIGAISGADYISDVSDAKLVLKGKTAKLREVLTKKMKKASADQQYEIALGFRNKIAALARLSEKQSVEKTKKYDEDIINYTVRKGRMYIMMFNVSRGILENKQEFEFDHTEDTFEEFLIRYYADQPVPKEIILPNPVSQGMLGYLTKQRGNSVRASVPQMGTKKSLLDLVKKNIEISFFGEEASLEAVQKKLRLQELPVIMECFDISHLSGTHTVASMVQFRNGKPDKSNYRRFKIKTVDGIDDFASIAEVVKRRYQRVVSEKLDVPNLIVIDGGKGQLSAALESLREVGLVVPIIGIAKKFEEIYFPGRSLPLQLSKKDKALQVIQQMRDEAHRFAINYNRLLRKKAIREK